VGKTHSEIMNESNSTRKREGGTERGVESGATRGSKYERGEVKCDEERGIGTEEKEEEWEGGGVQPGVTLGLK
jgi:hypothetical protein